MKSGGIPKCFTITKTTTPQIFDVLRVTYPPLLQYILNINTIYRENTDNTESKGGGILCLTFRINSHVYVCEGGVCSFGYSCSIKVYSAQKMRSKW